MRDYTEMSWNELIAYAMLIPEEDRESAVLIFDNYDKLPIVGIKVEDFIVDGKVHGKEYILQIPPPLDEEQLKALGIDKDNQKGA